MSKFTKVLVGLKEATSVAMGCAAGAVVTQKVYERTSNVPVSAAAGGATSVGVYYAASYTGGAVLSAAGIATPATGEQVKANKDAKKAAKKAEKEQKKADKAAKKQQKQMIEEAKDAAEESVYADEAVEQLLDYANDQPAEEAPEEDAVAEEAVEEPKAEETPKPAPKATTRKRNRK